MNVDRHNVRCTSDLRGHDRGKANSARSEDRYRTGRNDASRDKDGSCAGEQSAAKRSKELNGERRVDDDCIARCGQRIRRKRRLSKPASRNTVTMSVDYWDVSPGRPTAPVAQHVRVAPSWMPSKAVPTGST